MSNTPYVFKSCQNSNTNFCSNQSSSNQPISSNFSSARYTNKFLTSPVQNICEYNNVSKGILHLKSASNNTDNALSKITSVNSKKLMERSVLLRNTSNAVSEYKDEDKENWNCFERKNSMDRNTEYVSYVNSTSSQINKSVIKHNTENHHSMFNRIVTPKDKIQFTSLTGTKLKKVNTTGVSSFLNSAYVRPDKSFIHEDKITPTDLVYAENKTDERSVSKPLKSYCSLPQCRNVTNTYPVELPPIVQRLQQASAFFSNLPRHVEPGTQNLDCDDDDDDDDDQDEVEEEKNRSLSSEYSQSKNECNDIFDTTDDDVKYAYDNPAQQSLETIRECNTRLCNEVPSILQEDNSGIHHKNLVLNKCKAGALIESKSDKVVCQVNANNRQFRKSDGGQQQQTPSISHPPSASEDRNVKEIIHADLSRNSTASTTSEVDKIQYLDSTSIKSNKLLKVNNKIYIRLKVLGKGGSSKVYQVYDNETGDILAVKKIDLTGLDSSVKESYMNEITILHKLQRCDRVVKMIDFEYCENSKEILVVMEKGDADLSKAIQNSASSEQLSPVTVKFYWSEMLKAVKEIHDAGIIHSDLKPVNFILVSGKLKLIDFGISSSLQKDMTSVTKDNAIGTINYMPPETLCDRSMHYPSNQRNKSRKIKINRKSDVWSLGCILYNLVYGQTPFQHIRNVFSKREAIINPNYKIKFTPLDNDALMNVLQLCLIRDPSQRPSIEDLLKHPYLTAKSDGKMKVETTHTPSAVKVRSIMSQLLRNLTPRCKSQVETVAEKFNLLP